ncbi:MAG: response regulator, partial [Desulfobacterales bacterium]|nr:response regulator [Desulfobacterales bacterium]
MNEAKYPDFPIMLVDDEERTLHSYDIVLRAGGVNNTLCCQDSREVMPILSQREVEVVLLDLTMPHVSGEELLARIVREHPETPVIIITGADDVGTAVK